jgi:bifunctional non-homologous end joining protein LigD
MSVLPPPMLARSGRIPTSGDYDYEVKWDGFRAIVRTEGEFRVRSRRGWNMTALVPEFAEPAARGIFDGELVAFGCDGLPSFPAVCQRLLHRDASIVLTYMVFDVLELDGRSTKELPYRERRRLLESLRLEGPRWFMPAHFDDGEALFAVVEEQGLEGVVAKRLEGRYRPGGATGSRRRTMRTGALGRNGSLLALDRARG